MLVVNIVLKYVSLVLIGGFGLSLVRAGGDKSDGMTFDGGFLQVLHFEVEEVPGSTQTPLLLFGPHLSTNCSNFDWKRYKSTRVGKFLVTLTPPTRGGTPSLTSDYSSEPL